MPKKIWGKRIMVNSNRSQRPKWLKGNKPIIGGSESESNKKEMNFKKAKARKQRPATNKGRRAGIHKAPDNIKHRR